MSRQHAFLPLSWVMILMLLSAKVVAKSVYVVDSQSRFDSIPTWLKQQLEGGEKDVRISLADRTFYFKENHIQLQNMHYPHVRISISGQEGTKVVSGGMGYANGSQYSLTFNHQNTYLDENLQEKSLWGQTYNAADTIRVVDTESKLCFIPYHGLEPQTAELCQCTHVLITMWFYSTIYKVERITSDGVYFICNDLSFNSGVGTYNVNMDFGYSRLAHKQKCIPRFRLCNVLKAGNAIIGKQVRTSSSSLRECRNGTFVHVKDCSFNSFRLEKIAFIGNANSRWQCSLLRFENVTSRNGISLLHNDFSSLKTLAVSLDKTDNVSFKGNNAEDCALGILRSGNDCRNTKVENNTFQRCGTRLTNIPIVQVCGTDYLVKKNVFADFGYTGISIGVHWTLEMVYPCSGVAEDNELYYTQYTLANINANTLMDSGAIYVATQNASTVVRNNSIHDYAGVLDYRGIFCDDGASNCLVIGNRICRTPTSFSIQFRERDYSNESRNKSPYFSQGNRAIKNQCDGEIRFK